jgi:hypothetical protein
MDYHNQLDRVKDDEIDAPRLPFRPKADISADARYIVKHLWIIFVIFPFILGLVLYILR